MGRCPLITNEHLETIGNITSLKNLNLSSCAGISDHGISFLIHIQRLSLMNCNVNGEGLSELHQMKHINLTNTHITAQSLLPLAESVNHFDLSGCTQLREFPYRWSLFLKQLKPLTVVNISYCSFSDRFFNDLDSNRSIRIIGWVKA